MRLPREVLVVVRRGGEVLVARRAPDQGGYWHAIAGAVEPGETDEQAALRELREETGLAGELLPLRHRFDYPLAEEPERAGEYEPGTTSIAVACFAVDAPAGWEPELNEEHDGYRWCSLDEARALMRWPDAAAAVALLAE